MPTSLDPTIVLNVSSLSKTRTYTADRFVTVTTKPLALQGQVSIVPAPLDASGTTGTWLDETGEPWTQGGAGQPPLSYKVIDSSTANQVVTFQVTGGSLATPFIIYGFVYAWNSVAIIFQGFTSYDPATGALADPLPGKSGFFDFASQSQESTQGFTPGGSSYNDPISGPFFLSTSAPVSCFAQGTAILTPAGPVAVERLAAGDPVSTTSGEARPVIWIGRSTVNAAHHPQPARIMPVRIAPGAFGSGLPQRMLSLSPEHAIYQGGALIPVRCLVNGTTIRHEAVDAITYYHVELERHDVLLAEGLPAESYLDTGIRTAMTLQGPEAHAA